MDFRSKLLTISVICTPFPIPLRSAPGRSGLWPIPSPLPDYRRLMRRYPRATFHTDDAAPVASTIEGWTIRDTDQVWAVSGGALTPSKTNVTSYEPNIHIAAGVARQAGRFIKARMSSEIYGATFPQNSPGIGFSNTFHATSGTMFNSISTYTLIFSPSKFNLLGKYGAISLDTRITSVPSTYYNLLAICRPQGMFYVVDGKLAGIDPLGTEATLYPGAWTIVADRYQPKLDYLATGLLPGVWRNEASWADYYSTSAASAGQTYSHAADTIMTFKVDTIPSGANLQVAIRKQDSNNMWRVNIDSSGNLNLRQVTGGTPTNRGLTLTCQAGDYVELIARGNEYSLIRWRAGAHTNTTYTDAGSQGITLTAGEVVSLGTGGAISELRLWPIDLPSSALAWANAA